MLILFSASFSTSNKSNQLPQNTFNIDVNLKKKYLTHSDWIGIQSKPIKAGQYIYFWQNNRIFIFNTNEFNFEQIHLSEQSNVEYFHTDGNYFAVIRASSYILDSIFPELIIGKLSDLKREKDFFSSQKVRLPFSHNPLSIKFIKSGELLVTTLLEACIVKIFSNQTAQLEFSYELLPVPSGASYATFIINTSIVQDIEIINSSYELFLLTKNDSIREIKSVFNIAEEYNQSNFVGQLPIISEAVMIDSNLILSKIGDKLLLLKKNADNDYERIYIDSIRTNKDHFVNSSQLHTLSPLNKKEIWLTSFDNSVFRLNINSSVDSIQLHTVTSGQPEQIIVSIDFTSSGNALIFYYNMLCIIAKDDIQNDNLLTVPNKSFLFNINQYWDNSNTYGIGISDINNNGNEEVYLIDLLSNNKIFFKVFPSDYDNNIALNRGLLKRDRTRPEHGFEYSLNLGVTCGDLNEDGSEDFVVSYLDGPIALLLNNGNGFFRDATKDYGLNINMWRCETVILGDVNNDGYLDIFATSFIKSNRLFLNDKGRRFIDFTASSGLVSEGLSVTASFADVNGDGLLDLYVGNWIRPNNLYINNGDGTFTDFSEKSGTGIFGHHKKTNSVLFADFDNDGDLDLYIGNRGSGNKLFLNDGSGFFTDVTTAAGLNDSLFTYGSVAGDFSNRGLLDIVVSDFDGLRIYQNIGNNENGIPQFHNATRELVKPLSYLKGYITGVATFDKNKNGTLDILAGRFRGTDILLENKGSNKNSFSVEVKGYKSNRSGIGAKLWLFANDSLIAFREVSGGSGYASSSSKVQHFGLPDSNSKYKIKIEFPASGVIKEYPVSSGSKVIAEEYSGLTQIYFSGIKGINRMIVKENTYIFLLKIGALLLLCILTVNMGNLKPFRFSGKYLLLRWKYILITIMIFILTSILIAYIQPEKLNSHLWISGVRNVFLDDFLPMSISFLVFLFLNYAVKSRVETSFGSYSDAFNQIRKFNHGESLVINLNRIGMFISNQEKILISEEKQNRFRIAVDEFNQIYYSELMFFANTLANFNIREKEINNLNRIGREIRYETEKLHYYLDSIIKQPGVKLFNIIIYGASFNRSKIKSIENSINKLLEKIRESAIELNQAFSCDAIDILKLVLQKFNGKNDSAVVKLQTSLKECRTIFSKIELYEVITNLIHNAFQSISSNDNSQSQLIIRCSRFDSKLIIIFRDNGCGMSRDVQQKVFEKDFTTKLSGTGFGLYHAKNLIEKYNGTIKLRSIENRGTIIQIELNVI